MPRVLEAIALVSAVSLTVGCGSARLVQRDRLGGTIALVGDRGEGMKHARQMMLHHCRGPYQIIEEGETIVGQTTTSGAETYVAEDGTEVTETGTTTANDTEWRIRYLCGERQRATVRGRFESPAAPPPPDDGYPAPPPDDGYPAPPPEEGAPPLPDDGVPPPPDDASPPAPPGAPYPPAPI